VAAAAGLPALFLSTIAEYLVDALSDAAQKELAKYAAAYTAEADHVFYQHPSGNGFTPPLAIRCLRFVRYDRKAKVVRLDEIVQLRIDPSGDALQVRPLRVYFGRGSFVNNEPGQKVSFSSSLEIEAVWYDGNIGRSKSLFTYQFLRPKEFVAPTDAKTDSFHYFNIKDGVVAAEWPGAKRLPLPPMSVDSSNTLSSPVVTYRVAGAEAGPVPAWLADVASFLKAKKDDLSKLLGDALKHSAGISTSSS